MRIFKGLENIHAVIDSHDNEWRREQGEPEITPFVPVRERVEKIERRGKGGRDPNRFLGASPEKDSDTELEIIEPIKQEGTQHSWLYNEIKKAVEDAVGDSKRKTKVVAIIVPVIQSGKEFEDMPVDEKVTLPPVQEEIPEEDSEMPFEITIDESAPAEPEIPAAEAPEEEVEEIKEETGGEISEEPEPEPAPEEINAGTEAEDTETEEHHDFNLIPESSEHPDDELAEAFSTMEEKLTSASEAPAPETVTEIEAESANANEEPFTETEQEIESAEPEAGTESEPKPESEAEIEGTFPETEIHAEEAELMAEDPVQELDADFSEIQEELDEAGEAGEKMSFDEFPVLKDENPAAENENTETPVEEFIEEVTPEAAADSEADVDNEKRDVISEPPSIEDFDDDEIFEESLETLETGEIENEEAENDDIDDIAEDEVIRLD